MGDPGDLDGRTPIRGVGVDASGRCAHWASPRDIVSFRFPCCDGWWACRDCHDDVAGHPAETWPRTRFGERAVLCGACRTRLAVEVYLASPGACPRCAAPFNPGCVGHHPLYFEVEGPG